MSKHLGLTLVELKRFMDMTPLFNDITFSKGKDVVLVVYEWGEGTAYVRWDIDDKKRKIRFSIDYGIRCDEAYTMQMSTFLTHLNAENDDVKMSLHPDGRVVSEGSLSYKNAPLKKDDFDNLFTSSFFFERFISELRKLSVGGFIFAQEIVKAKIDENRPILFDDFDDDDLDDISSPSLSGLFGSNTVSPIKTEPPNLDKFFQHMREVDTNSSFPKEIKKNENSELVSLINSVDKKDNDNDKEDE